MNEETLPVVFTVGRVTLGMPAEPVAFNDVLDDACEELEELRKPDELLLEELSDELLEFMELDEVLLFYC